MQMTKLQFGILVENGLETVETHHFESRAVVFEDCGIFTYPIVLLHIAALDVRADRRSQTAVYF